MDVVIEHLREYYVFYIIAGLGLLPIVYISRKWSVPFILYVAEIVVYAGLMHVAMYVLVRVTAWFKETSSMKALRPDGRPADAPDWTTPIVEFWDKSGYRPEWLVWVEVTFAVIVVLLVWRYRPMKVQHKHKKRHFATEGGRKLYEQSPAGRHAASSGGGKGRRGRR